MKKLFLTLYFLSSTILYAKIEVLDRIAVIVDDGVIMESQITKTLADVSKRYDDQNIPPPPADILLEQVTEKLIIEELQLQMADRAGVRISDAELNLTLSRLAANNQLSLEEFVVFVEENGDSYEDLREQMRREMRIQRIQRGRVLSLIHI